MMNRRELLTHGTTLLLLVPILSGCSSSSSGTDASGGSCAGIDTTSSVDDAHSHMMCVLTTDLTAPPSAGVTYTTTLVSGHTHTVMLTEANLTAIEAGTSVMVTSSSAIDDVNGDAHTHTFTIVKM